MRHLRFLLLPILVLLGCTKTDDANVISDIALNDLRPLVEVVEYMYTNPPKDNSVRKKIEVMILGKLISVRALNPNVEKLKGASLKGLCAAIIFSKSSDFGVSVNDSELTNLAKSYLGSIEPRIKARANELKQTVFTNADCAI